MTSRLQKIFAKRLEKLENLKQKGLDPYPITTKRSHTVSKALANFSELCKRNKTLFLAGRIRSLRTHGGIIFADLEDGTGKIQLFLARDLLGEENFTLFLKDFDIGDFLQVQGRLFKTQAGEKTLRVRQFKLLGKSLYPLPEKWHGLQDKEVRFRRRYLDLLMNPRVKQRFKLRFQIIKALRGFFDKQGFTEVTTPILQVVPGGALARPFKTHLQALDLPLYLRVAPELYLKRLLIGGFEKIFELGYAFRNEGIDASHNPEFTILEAYWAYQDHQGLMTFVQKMLQQIVNQVFSKKTLEITNSKGKKLQLHFGKNTWPKVPFTELLKENTGLDFDKVSQQELSNQAKKMGLELNSGLAKGKIADEILKKRVLPRIIQPTFIVNHPLDISPLAKQLPEDVSKVARFQLIIGGQEVINAFAELNDPLEQKRRFQMQKKQAQKGDLEVQPYDKEFLQALYYGMPPAAGLGIGVDRLVMIFSGAPNLKEVILFPTMRPR